VNHDASERNAAEVINSENIDGSDGNLSYFVSINQILHVLLPGLALYTHHSTVLCFVF